jgi:hypothetical protein
MKKYPIIFTLFLAVCAVQVPAQSADTSRIRLELKDGSILIGTVTDEDSVTLRFRTINGIPVTVPHTQIRFKLPYSAVAPSAADSITPKYQMLDPNRTRLFLMPTARPIGNGRGYFSAYELFFPTIAFGIGSAVSVAGGMSMFPGAEDQLIYFAPKVTLWNSNSLSVALGSLYMGTSGNGNGSSLIYAAGTVGNERSSLTLASRIPTESGQNTLFVIGGEMQLSESFKFITENWIVDDDMLYSFGFRFFGERIAADLGFIRSADADGDGFPFFPWLGFAYNFGALEPASIAPAAPVDYPPVTYRGRISFNFFTFSDHEAFQQSLRDQNFYTYDYGGGIFSSGSSRSTRGNGFLLQVERLVKEHLFAGITVSTIGDLIGSPATITANRYHYQNSYYLNTDLTIGRSVSTYGVHLAYSSMNSDADQNRQSYTLGAGFGTTDVTMDWDYRGYGSYGTAGTTSVSHSSYTGILFMLIEQRISGHITVGLDGSYFMMPDAVLNAFHLYDQTFTDTSVNPPQVRTNSVDVQRITTNFTYGKIGINIGMTF